MAGHVMVPIYPTLTKNKVQHIIDHSESKLYFVGKLDKVPWDEMKGARTADLLIETFPLCPVDAQYRWLGYYS